MDQNQYAGPAPVRLEAYTKMVLASSVSGQTITQERMRNALSHLVIERDGAQSIRARP